VTAVPGQDDPAQPAPRGPADPVVVDVSSLCAGLPASPAGEGPGGGPGGWDASFGPDGGLAVVAALARLRLAARRTGHRVRLSGASPQLRKLLELVGLAGEFEWQAEEGEEAGGVEE
jgi:hypothetical protein